jgi:hypothetical protein
MDIFTAGTRRLTEASLVKRVPHSLSFPSRALSSTHGFAPTLTTTYPASLCIQRFTNAGWSLRPIRSGKSGKMLHKLMCQPNQKYGSCHSHGTANQEACAENSLAQDTGAIVTARHDNMSELNFPTTGFQLCQGKGPVVKDSASEVGGSRSS